MANIFDRADNAWMIVRDFQGMRRDMRANAQRYKDALAAGKAVAEVAAVSDANAAEYLRRLDRVRDVYNAHTAAVEDGIKRAYGHTSTDEEPVTVLKNMHTTLREWAVYERDASKNNAQQITTMADDILANVTAPISIW